MPRTLAIVVVFWVAAFGILVGSGMVRGLAPEPVSGLAWGITSSLGLLGLTAAFLRWERRGASSAGMRWQWTSIPRFVLGAVFGGVLYAGHMLVLLSMTDVHLVWAPAVPPVRLGLVLVTYLALSSMEEIAFRGYPLRRLEERMGRAGALVLGAVAFGSLHLAYGWSVGAAIVGAAAGGMLFGMAALVSRGLAVPIGLHAAWNVASWSVGEKDGAGIWQMVIPEAASRTAAVGTISYLAVMAVGVLGLWQFGRLRKPREHGSVGPTPS